MLTVENIRKRAQGRRNELGLMRKHQDWVKMHCDTRLDLTGSEALTSFLGMVGGLLTDEKMEMFRSLLRSPLPTTALTGVIFDRLSRVFEGRDPSYNYQFEKREYADDWEWYRSEVLKEPEVWRNKGWNFYKTEPNSILVVDLPVEGRTDKEDAYLQPYFYWVTLDDLVDYDTDDNGGLRWVMYKDERQHVMHVVDETSYRVFEMHAVRDTATGDIIGKEVVHNEHGLGYCPAIFFVDTPVSLSTPDVKRSAVTDVLSELDWYLFYAVSKKHLDTYGSYPIYSGYERMCDYQDEVHDGETALHRHCQGGVLCDDYDNALRNPDGSLLRCPKCGGHRIAGAGSFVEIPAPVDGMPDMKNPVQILTVDRGSLDYVQDEMGRLKRELIQTCVGVDADTLGDFSVGEHQVDANFESQGTILIRLKKVFERAQEFVDATCCRLRYGRGFVSCDIDYGTEFYATSTAQMRKRYKEAKSGGASDADLQALRRRVIETEYRNDKLQMQRMLILDDVEPLAGLGRTEALNMYNQGLVDEYDMRVKANFDALVRRFELENGNVLNFGLQLGYDKKIEKIKETLKRYVEGIKTRGADPRGVQGGSGGGSEEGDGE